MKRLKIGTNIKNRKISQPRVILVPIILKRNDSSVITVLIAVRNVLEQCSTTIYGKKYFLSLKIRNPGQKVR